METEQRKGRFNFSGMITGLIILSVCFKFFSYTDLVYGWGVSPLAPLVAGDFNGDGRDDLAGINSSQKVYYSVDLATWQNIPAALIQLAVGDFNGDGRTDLAGINSSGEIYYTVDLATWQNILLPLDPY